MLTARQQEIWNYLVEYVDRHGYPPTVREIGEQVGLASPSTVHAHLANLERAGLLRRDPTKPRALELIGRERREAEPRRRRRPATSRGCRSSARSPPAARCSPSRTSRSTSRCRRPTKGDFLLRVKGESMIDAGILDGDLVIVQRAQDARNGEIVVALAGDDETADEATVKTFYREGRQHPAAARERLDGADLRRRTSRSSVASSGSSGSSRRLTTSRRFTARSTRSSSRCCAARRSSA